MTGKMLPPICIEGSAICIIPDRIVHTMACVKQVVEHWLEREIDQYIYQERSI